jgi:hypothetical protein
LTDDNEDLQALYLDTVWMCGSRKAAIIAAAAGISKAGGSGPEHDQIA